MAANDSPSTSTHCYQLKCSLRVESTDSSVKKGAIASKNALVTVGRNSSRDIVLQAEMSSRRPVTVSYPLSECVIHQKLAMKGLGSIEIPNRKLVIQLANCPPRQLNIFLKSILAKVDIMKAESSGSKVRTPLSKSKKLLMGLPRVFNVLSPLTVAEIRQVRRLRGVGVATGRSPLAKVLNGSPRTPEPGSSRKKQVTTPVVAPGTSKCRYSVDFTMADRVPLTIEQRLVLRTVIKGGQNVFCTGGAGTGKSLVLRRIIEQLPCATTFVTAATGVAACQLGGVTLHSFAGIGIGGDKEQSLKRASSNRLTVRQWRSCSHLIIDEISMIDANYFDTIEYVARKVRNDDRPFGGIQLIITGDFLQLPPVVKGTEIPKFCFEGSAWSRCIHRTIVLKEVRRQTDLRFVEILNNIRIGRCDSKSTHTLVETRNNDFAGVVPTRLCTHISEAEMINTISLQKLTGEEVLFEAEDSNVIHDSSTQAVRSLVLKQGAEVMLNKNMDLSRGLSNGARGVVVRFSPRGLPIVKFVAVQEELEIPRIRFLVRVPGLDAPACRLQVPLQLAWAISIHKSQGLTLDAVEINLANAFAEGQGYVALSRARSLSSIRVVGFQPHYIRANSNVISYYESLQSSSVADDDEDFIIRKRSRPLI